MSVEVNSKGQPFTTATECKHCGISRKDYKKKWVLAGGSPNGAGKSWSGHYPHCGGTYPFPTADGDDWSKLHKPPTSMKRKAPAKATAAAAPPAKKHKPAEAPIAPAAAPVPPPSPKDQLHAEEQKAGVLPLHEQLIASTKKYQAILLEREAHLVKVNADHDREKAINEEELKIVRKSSTAYQKLEAELAA
jgi:hypothetical protein